MEPNLITYLGIGYMIIGIMNLLTVLFRLGKIDFSYTEKLYERIWDLRVPDLKEQTFTGIKFIIGGILMVMLSPLFDFKSW